MKDLGFTDSDEDEEVESDSDEDQSRGSGGDEGDDQPTNYWKLLNMHWNYFTIGWMGIATITQLLSMLGIAAEINLMVWMYGGIVNMVVSFISGLVAMYAYDAYWSVAEDSTSSE